MVRLFGTRNQAEPRFAFQGTINWMKALAILVDSNDFSGGNGEQLYFIVLNSY